MANKKEDKPTEPGIRIKTDLHYGDIVYVINDPKQKEYTLTGLTLRPGGQIIFLLDYVGEEIEVYDFECSTTIDQMKVMKSREQGDDEDDE